MRIAIEVGLKLGLREQELMYAEWTTWTGKNRHSEFKERSSGILSDDYQIPVILNPAEVSSGPQKCHMAVFEDQLW
jgi:hypothetical protein